MSAGDPRIEVFASDTGFSIMPYMMEEGEETIVARRCSEILGARRRG